MPVGIGAPNPSGLPGNNAAAGLSSGTTVGQTYATQLPSWLNEVATSGTPSGGVMLPPGYGGERVTVINDTNQTITVYGYLPTNVPGPGGTTSTGPGDTIAAHTSTTQTTSSTGITQASGVVSDYVCFVGQGGNTQAPTAASWKQILSL